MCEARVSISSSPVGMEGQSWEPGQTCSSHSTLIGPVITYTIITVRLFWLLALKTKRKKKAVKRRMRMSGVSVMAYWERWCE